MSILTSQKKSNKFFFIAACIIMLSMVFFQGYKTTHDLNWAFDPDFDRDISFAKGTLEGKFGKDPNYKGEYLWYNPLLFSIEAAISKITSTPVNIVATRAGAYLNLLGPIAFVAMACFLFGAEIGVAALLAFLFFSSGNIVGGDAATYSPWLYPVYFAQFIFYANIVLCYKAFTEQAYSWFILLGLSIGISFLAHTGPTVMIILITLSVQSQKIFASIKNKTDQLIKKYFLQGIITFCFFAVASLPLTYYVIGKYHLHLINRNTFEWTDGIFYLSRYKEMIKANLSVSLFVAIIGFVWFYKKFHQPLVRRIILSWLLSAIIMYFYSTLVGLLDNKYHIHLPGTVPSFHYFFYLKAVQSVFFGFGFVFLLSPVIVWVMNTIKRGNPNENANTPAIIFSFAVLICAIVYFPFYQQRDDFGLMRDEALAKQNDKGKVGVYNFISEHIPSEKVILCDKDPSLFPVMATARKMVSIAFTFSNPYLDFEKRENDRVNMLSFLKTGKPAEAKELFSEYDVSYVLLSNAGLDKNANSIAGRIVYSNEDFTMFEFKK